MISLILRMLAMRATPPWARMSAGTRSNAITDTAPASSAILACSALVTSMMTPPLSISARPIFNFDVPVCTSGSCLRVVQGLQFGFRFHRFGTGFHHLLLFSSYGCWLAQATGPVPSRDYTSGGPSCLSAERKRRPLWRAASITLDNRCTPTSICSAGTSENDSAIGCAPHRRRIGSPVYTRPQRWPPRGGGFWDQAPRAALTATKSPLRMGPGDVGRAMSTESLYQVSRRRRYSRRMRSICRSSRRRRQKW